MAEFRPRNDVQQHMYNSASSRCKPFAAFCSGCSIFLRCLSGAGGYRPPGSPPKAPPARAGGAFFLGGGGSGGR
eukprot:14523275-Alexandrium_andersonii.AAC.1